MRLGRNLGEGTAADPVADRGELAPDAAVDELVAPGRRAAAPEPAREPAREPAQAERHAAV